MSPQRLAGTGAALALLVSVSSIGVSALSGADTAWRLTLLFLPIWPGLMLLASARAVRSTRGLAAAAFVIAAAQYAAVELLFNGFQWGAALTLLPVALLALGAVAVPVREKPRPTGVPVH